MNMIIDNMQAFIHTYVLGNARARARTHTRTCTESCAYKRYDNHVQRLVARKIFKCPSIHRHSHKRLG